MAGLFSDSVVRIGTLNQRSSILDTCMLSLFYKTIFNVKLRGILLIQGSTFFIREMLNNRTEMKCI